MKELYSIGDTANIMGVSVQMLRNYSNLKLLEPQYIDPETGYRYYFFKQFHYIDRIKYLRKLRLSLKEIAEILHSGKPDKMLFYLERSKSRMIKELKDLVDEYDDLQWYIDYFRYLDKYRMENIPYIVQRPTRYIMYVDYLNNDNDESVETRLAKLKNENDFKYRRQYGYIMDTDAFFSKLFKPKKYFIHLKERPKNMDKNYLLEIPAGVYMCLWANKITIESSLVKKFFCDHIKPKYVIAEEYEDNFIEYDYCPYEMQCLVKKDTKI